LDSTAVSTDFKNLIYVLGADLKSTWGSSGVDNTHDWWKYMTKIDEEVKTVQS